MVSKVIKKGVFYIMQSVLSRLEPGITNEHEIIFLVVVVHVCMTFHTNNSSDFCYY